MIRKLPDDVRHSLRSGFAVASVRQCVEELLLNSTDSQSTCIAVRLDLETLSVQVVDNGRGLCEGDLDKAGIRYFTSKCHSLKDLESLAFYGFRGEALASIAEVSSVVEISSRWKDDTKTFTKLISNGKPGQVSEAAVSRPSPGTTVTIYNLFYNLPVRRKCIDPVLEFERVRQGVEALSLVQPSISYSLKNDASNSMVLKLPKSKDMNFRFCQVYGLAHSQRLREMGHTQKGFTVSGLISREGHYNTAMQHLYVNKRLVLKTRIHKLIDWTLRKESIICRSRSTSHAGKLHAAPELHAIFVIDIQCGRHEYDVCFEPAKTLIEFRDWDALLGCVEEGVRMFLKREEVFLDPSKGDDGESSVNIPFGASQSVFRHTEELEQCLFEDVCERVSEHHKLSNLASKSVCWGTITTDVSQVSGSRTGETAPEMPSQSPPSSHRMSECPPVLEDKRKISLVSASTTHDSVEQLKRLYGKARHTAGCPAFGIQETSMKEDNEDVADAPRRIDPHSLIAGRPTTALSINSTDNRHTSSRAGFPMLGVHDFERDGEQNPKFKFFSRPGSKKVSEDLGAERKAIPHTSSSNEYRSGPCRTSGCPPMPASRKISLVAPRMDSLRRFKSRHGKTQRWATSSPVQYSSPSCHVGSEKSQSGAGFGNNNIMEETLQWSLQSNFQLTSFASVTEVKEDPGEQLSVPSPLTLPKVALLDRNSSRPQPGHGSLSAKLSNLKQTIQSDRLVKTPRAGVTGTLAYGLPSELSTGATFLPSATAQQMASDADLSPQTKSEEQKVCTPETPLLDSDLVPPDLSNPSPHSSDWIMVYDASIGRNVFINRVTGMSSYEGPQNESKSLCQTDLTTTSICVVRSDGSRYQSYPFRSENLVPFLPEPHGEREALRVARTAADPEDCSLWCDFSQWENPVFRLHPAVAVNVSSGHADTLAVKIHNILYPYRFTKDMVRSMKVLQQVDSKFIACLVDIKKEKSADPDGNLLVLVDQHAAHERVRLEQLIADSYETVPRGSGAKQMKVSAVNPPLELDVTEEQHRLLSVFASWLSKVGLSVSFPGSNSRRVLVRTVPLCFVEKEANETQRGRSPVTKKIVEEFLREQVEMFQTSGAGTRPIPLTVLKVLASQACHGAIKFNDSLTVAECKHLIQSLSQCNLPFQCAHGRPAILPLADIAHLDTEQQALQKPNLRRLQTQLKSMQKRDFNPSVC